MCLEDMRESAKRDTICTRKMDMQSKTLTTKHKEHSIRASASSICLCLMETLQLQGVRCKE